MGKPHRGSPKCKDSEPRESLPSMLTFGMCRFHRCQLGGENRGSENHGCTIQFFSADDALTLLRHSFAIPKLHYLLRTAPCFFSEQLEEYDSTLCSIMSEVTNTPLLQDDKAWAQATLPIRVGGLGVRSASVLAPSAYLSSYTATADLVHTILPDTHQSLPVPSRDVCSGNLV